MLHDGDSAAGDREELLRSCSETLPYPIANVLRRLFTDDYLDPDRNRYQLILDIGESVARFLGSVILLECREVLEADPAESIALSDDFERSFTRPSFGMWLPFAARGVRWLVRRQATLTVPEIAGYLLANPASSKLRASAALDALQSLVEMRNRTAHGGNNQDFFSLCETAESHLATIFQDFGFLGRQSVGFIGSIEVQKTRTTKPSYLHRVQKLHGHSYQFEGYLPKYDYIRDPNAVVLRYDGDRSLNLGPLYLFEQRAGNAPDVFYYNGGDLPRKALYTGCGPGKPFETDVPAFRARASEVVRELEHLVSLFSRSARPSENEQ